MISRALAICCLAFCWPAAAGNEPQVAVETALKRLEELGYPMKPGDLLSKPLPPEKNGLVLLQPYAGFYRKKFPEVWKYAPYNGVDGWKGDAVPLAKKKRVGTIMLTDPAIETFIQTLFKASRLECRYAGNPEEFGSGKYTDVLLPALSRTRGWTRTLTERAYVCCLANKPQEAYEHCLASLRLNTRTAGRSPTAISVLVYAAMVEMSVREISRTLATGEARAKTFRELLEALRLARSRLILTPALKAEFLFLHRQTWAAWQDHSDDELAKALIATRQKWNQWNLGSWDETRRKLGVDDATWRRILGRKITPENARDHLNAEYLLLLEFFAAALPALNAAEYPQQRTDNLLKLRTRGEWDTTVGMWLIPWNDKLMIVAAKAAILEHAVALRLYRLRHGGYPDRLRDLPANVLKLLPKDPYTNKPMIYRRQGKSVLVYSVGPDRKDDAGKPFLRRQLANDIIWKDSGTFRRPNWEDQWPPWKRQ